uniref:hypothetical protein n=1 Tax=Pedobacter schmidteae TaxID=2201271 RepID=UPI000EB17E93|nr:hypothetical protein [Pedobacter schmidteae]
MNTSYKYNYMAHKPDALYGLAAQCLELLLKQLEGGAVGFLAGKMASSEAGLQDHRIRVSFSVDALAYFFKLMHKAGGLDAGPVAQLLIAVSKNFVTTGLGNAYISVGSLTVKYKQVVQRSATTVRALLVKMLKQLDEEFILR